MNLSKTKQNKIFQEPEGKITYDDWELICPICLETMILPAFGKCAHTFCYQCISQSLQVNRFCPVCWDYLHEDLIFFNKNMEYFLNEKRRKENCADTSGLGQTLRFNAKAKDLNYSRSLSGRTMRLVRKRLKNKLNDIDKELENVQDIENRILTKYGSISKRSKLITNNDTFKKEFHTSTSERGKQSCSVDVMNLTVTFKSIQQNKEESNRNVISVEEKPELKLKVETKSFLS